MSLREMHKEMSKGLQESFDHYKGPRGEWVRDYFRVTVADLWIAYMRRANRKDGAMESDAMSESKNVIINLFRGLELNDSQLSEDKYSDMFDAAIQEILEHAGGNHAGTNTMAKRTADGSDIIIAQDLSML